MKSYSDFQLNLSTTTQALKDNVLDNPCWFVRFHLSCDLLTKSFENITV